MPPTSSSSTASTEGPSESGQDEANSVYKVIKQLRGDTQVAIIAIVRPGALKFLEKKCRVSFWRKWLRDNSTILCTRDSDLDGTMKKLEEYRDNQASCYTKLVILASRQIEIISFKVSGQFRTLVIRRCEIHQQTDPSSGLLLINGASTFSGVRMDRWNARSRSRKFKPEGNIAFQVGTNWSNLGAGFRPSPNSFPPSYQSAMETQFNRMATADKRGEWWQDWKAAIAGILGLMAGGSKFVMGLDATAKGMFVQFQWGGMIFKAASASSKFSMATAGAGPAVVLGVGVAAAVYFIPWAEMLNWLQENVFSRFRTWLASLWERFRSWVSSQLNFLGNSSRRL
ncbi:hypothetical protein IFR05_015282 [Cadophora sp. M221]|nr:hypothetical protein IFR05_015282 [Cadophora sp. M221]